MIQNLTGILNHLHKGNKILLNSANNYWDNDFFKNNSFLGKATLITTPANGANYYRLKQVDFDGAFEYSEIRVVEIERTGKVVINPSAAIAEITVQLTETVGDNNQIGIYDMMGRTVLMSNFDGALDTKTLDISNLQKGYYVVRVQAGSQVFTERFMKMVD